MKKKEKHFNRIDSVIASLQQSKKPISKDQWASLANRLYVKHGGVANTKESEWAVRHSQAVLRALNMIDDKEGVITLK